EEPGQIEEPRAQPLVLERILGHRVWSGRERRDQEENQAGREQGGDGPQDAAEGIAEHCPPQLYNPHMDREELVRRAQRWMAEDPDPRTVEELRALLARPDLDATDLADRFAQTLEF